MIWLYLLPGIILSLLPVASLAAYHFLYMQSSKPLSQRVGAASPVFGLALAPLFSSSSFAFPHVSIAQSSHRVDQILVSR